jgi:hypothetical protein
MTGGTTGATILYVDVDNLYIQNNKISIPLLKKRVAAINGFAKKNKIMASNVHWFGNAFTADIITSNGVRIPPEHFITTNIDKDTADHMIIHSIATHKTPAHKPQAAQVAAQVKAQVVPQVYIVSNDISIANIAWLLCSQRFKVFRLKFMKGEDGSGGSLIRVMPVKKMELRNPDDMIKVMRSYFTYAQRYDPHLLDGFHERVP